MEDDDGQIANLRKLSLSSSQRLRAISGSVFTTFIMLQIEAVAATQDMGEQNNKVTAGKRAQWEGPPHPRKFLAFHEGLIEEVRDKDEAIHEGFSRDDAKGRYQARGRGHQALLHQADQSTTQIESRGRQPKEHKRARTWTRARGKIPKAAT